MDKMNQSESRTRGNDNQSQRQTEAVVYFVRHGESVANKTLTFLSPDKDILNENGKRQAKILGQYFNSQNEHFTMAFSSSYSRALETAQIITSWSNGSKSGQGQGQGQGQHFESKSNSNSSFAPLIPIVQDARLIERDMGLVDGQKIEGPLKEYQDSKKPFVEFSREGGETPDECTSRISSFLDDLFKVIDQAEVEVKGPQKILVLSHATYFLHMAKVLVTNPQKYKLVGKTPDYIRAVANTAFLKMVIQAQPSSSTVESNSSPNLATDEKIPRTIEILAWNGQDHLEEEEGNLNSDLNSNSHHGAGDGKGLAHTSISALNQIAAANEQYYQTNL